MSIKIRMRGKSKGGVAEVKALIKHKMESGARMNKKLASHIQLSSSTTLKFGKRN